MSVPTFSVVIPVFNQERYLEETLLSVLNQDGVDFEVVAINDGSTDRSGEILKRYAERLVLVEQPNMGLQQVRNIGIQKAKGKLIAFLDADDRFLPGHLAKMQAFQQEHPEALGFYGDVQLIDPEGGKLWVQRTPRAASLDNLVLGNYVVHSSVMLRTSFFERAEPYRPFGPASDWELWLRVLERGPMLHYPWLGGEYRTHPVSAIHQNLLETEVCSLKVLEDFFSRHKELALELQSKAYAMVYYDSMVRFLAAGQGREAGARAMNCLRREPLLLKAWAGLGLSFAPRPLTRLFVSLRRKFLRSLA